ncbi:hypothetical protein OsJ_08765 [Oryza sativa Japonica Group]|uniref:Uncharacterized protein n=1 Tax=Oryza sativa subsp. japonica TaxID=39947 RepID=B9F435_ORYSJ|nr:hypothetical protein OsJ_08765 [Oryza sativa Japonica Group]
MARVQQQQQHYATFNNNQINYHTPYALAQDAAGQRMESTVGINWFRRYPRYLPSTVKPL